MNTWTLRPRGVATVARLELAQRARSGRWMVVLGVWFAALLAMTGLLMTFLSAMEDWSWPTDGRRATGILLFSLICFFVLFIALVVLPVITGGSINGDRLDGTLATLQSTMLSPAEIVIGKILGGWVVAIAFLTVAAPFLLFAMLLGERDVLYLVRVLAILAALMLCFTAIGIGFSAATSRPIGSAILTYLTVAVLSFLTPVLFALSLPLATQTEQVRVWESGAWMADEWPPECVETVTERDVIHTDLTRGLVLVNPFVIMADVAPPTDLDTAVRPDVLSVIREGVRWTEHPRDPARYWSCYGIPGAERPDPQPTSPVWFWGLGLYVLMGAGGTLLAIHRVRTPVTTLPRGMRIA